MIPDLIEAIHANLTDDLLQPAFRGSTGKYAGHCYVACEALYHSTKRTLKPYSVHHEGSTHWFLRDESGNVIDPTYEQFTAPVPYQDGRGRGFLTCKPSKRARILLERIKNASKKQT